MGGHLVRVPLQPTDLRTRRKLRSPDPWVAMANGGGGVRRRWGRKASRRGNTRTQQGFQARGGVMSRGGSRTGGRGDAVTAARPPPHPCSAMTERGVNGSGIWLRKREGSGSGKGATGRRGRETTRKVALVTKGEPATACVILSDSRGARPPHGMGGGVAARVRSSCKSHPSRRVTLFRRTPECPNPGHYLHRLGTI